MLHGRTCVPLEDDLCTRVSIRTGGSAHGRYSRYGDIFIVANGVYGAGTLETAVAADLFSSGGNWRHLFQDFRNALGGHELGFAFLVDEALKRSDYDLAGLMVRTILHRSADSRAHLKPL